MYTQTRFSKVFETSAPHIINIASKEFKRPQYKRRTLYGIVVDALRRFSS